MPDALIFDLDDTLIGEAEVAMGRLADTSDLLPEPRPDRVSWRDNVLGVARAAWREAPFADLFRELGFASWEGLWSDGLGNHPRLDGLAEWLPGYREHTWCRAAETAGGGADLADRLATAFTSAQRSGHPLLDGAAETIGALAGRVGLGLLTNGPSDIQRLKLDQTGLARHFDSVVVSGELGRGKPDPAAFQQAARDLGVAAGGMVMIGDSWARDVVGAMEAGLAGAVWIAAGREVPSPGPARVTVVGGLAGPDLLRLLSGAGPDIGGGSDHPR